MTLRDDALRLHEMSAGKFEVASRVPLRGREDLNLAYTPGVAEPCKEIHRDPSLAYRYTAKGNLVAVVSDGTAVLGLGDIGPEAAMPVMEGKSLLFKAFGGVDAFPACVASRSVDDIVQFVRMLEPTIGGVNLEDISAPRCFEIEARLKRETSIPIFHDDQHGTAIVTLAAVINALRVVGKEISAAKYVVNGAGAAGMSTSLLLLDMGATDVTLCDRSGAIYAGRVEGMNESKHAIAARSNPRSCRTLAESMVGADVFIGLSAAGAVSSEMVRSMNSGAVVLAMANPVPEIFPDEAAAAGAAVVGTGRSDFPNQVNNVLAFPGVLRGALDARASDINEAMKVAAARAIAGLVTASELRADYIIPGAFDRRVAPAVAAAVAQAAVESGVARVAVDPAAIARRTAEMVEAANRKFGIV
jgi:malate dehydrogenase (oxaloacetate-decarboxylating)